MNKPQKVVVLVAVCVMAVMLLFPPWHELRANLGSTYAPLFRQPPTATGVDDERLFLQCAVVAVLAFGACVALSRKAGS
jgi:hypothetical protein